MKLFSNFFTVGFATLLSRILGYVRDLLMAAFVGTGPVADAFLVAFRLPNLFRRLFAEGAFNAAFVPLFARSLEEGEAEKNPEKASNFASEVLAVFLFTLLLLTALAEIATPFFVSILAPGFMDDAVKFELAVWLTRITFPYLLCMSLIAMLSGMLNTFGHFRAAAYGPILLNVIMVGVLAVIGLRGFGDTPISGYWLAWGVFVAGFVQLGVLYWMFRRTKFNLRLKRPRLTKSVKRLLALGVPGVIAGGITQINILVGTIIASTQDSAVSFLYYADRLYQFPLGIVGIAMGVVLLPVLSRHIRRDELQIASDTQNRAMELALALTLPAAMALFLVPDAVIRLMFERGNFTPEATIQTGAALAAFAWGLPAFVLIKVFSPGYFAREDTKTPMYFAGIGVAVNVAFSLALFPLFQHVGIAIATSLAGWANACCLGFMLWKRGHFVWDDSLHRRVPRLVLATLLTGAWIYYGANWLSPLLTDATFLVKFFGMGVLGTVSLAIFGLVCQFTGVFNALTIAQRIRSRSKG